MPPVATAASAINCGGSTLRGRRLFAGLPIHSDFWISQNDRTKPLLGIIYVTISIWTGCRVIASPVPALTLLVLRGAGLSR